MNDKKPSPAQLQRRITLLEGQLVAEREMAEKAWSGYRSTLHELVEIKMRLEAVELALRGGIVSALRVRCWEVVQAHNDEVPA